MHVQLGLRQPIDQFVDDDWRVPLHSRAPSVTSAYDTRCRFEFIRGAAAAAVRGDSVRFSRELLYCPAGDAPTNQAAGVTSMKRRTFCASALAGATAAALPLEHLFGATATRVASAIPAISRLG